MPPRAQAHALPREGPSDKRARILHAARHVCARMGYEASTMEAVAAEARVSKGTLYNYFPSKERLFLSTVLQAYDESEIAVQAQVGPTEDPRARLEALVDAVVDTFPTVAGGMMVNIQVWALVASDAEAREDMFRDLRARYARLDEDLATTLRAGQRAGVFREDFDPGSVATGFSAVLDGFVYRSVFDAEHASPAALRAALDGLVRERVLRQGERVRLQEEAR